MAPAWPGDLDGAVRRAVVVDEDQGVGQVLAEVRDHLRDRGLLVQAGDQDGDLGCPAHVRLQFRDDCSTLVAELDHPLDLVVLDRPRVREDDQFAEQSEREELQAEHDQQRRQQQGGALGQRLAEEQASRSTSQVTASAPNAKVLTPTMPKKRSGFLVKRTRKNTVKMSSRPRVYSRGW